MVKIKKLTSKQLQDRIWIECRRIINKREIKEDGTWECYTCGAKELGGSNKHIGHMIPKKYLPYQYKFDTRFLKIQCYNCNMNLGGMGATYLYNLLPQMNTHDIWSFFLNVENEKIKQKENPPKQKEVCEFYTTLLERLKLIKN